MSNEEIKRIICPFCQQKHFNTIPDHLRISDICEKCSFEQTKNRMEQMEEKNILLLKIKKNDWDLLKKIWLENNP